MVSAAAGLAFIHGYHRGKSPEERLQVVKLFVELGNDVNQPDDYGITPLMAAANYGNVPIIQYLIDAGADLAAHDLGKKNDGQFGSSVEPLMPIDYAIGVGTFVPNNAVIIHEDAVALMARLMKERGITHTTSECTLRGFTCAQARVDPKVATPAEIMRARTAGDRPPDRGRHRRAGGEIGAADRGDHGSVMRSHQADVRVLREGCALTLEGAAEQNEEAGSQSAPDRAGAV